jgi:hypothetical protein
MFYQNSNDLVKHASVSSGHVQNSHATRDVLLKQSSPSPAANIGGHGSINNDNYSTQSSRPTAVDDSLSIGAKFQNMVQSIIDTVSMKEGLTGTDNNGDQTQYVNDVADDSKKYSAQEIAYNQKLVKSMDFLDQKNPTNPRVTWAEVSDSAGNTKYGYITKDGIFQIWNAPGTPSDNWIQTDKMKTNTSVIGCPRPETMKKMKIAGTWDSIKAYDMVYSESDPGRKNPLFMLVNPNVRDPRNSNDRKGLFSCGNERGIVYVTERPSADFDMSNTTKSGCYTVRYSSKGGSFDFTPQLDLGDASISQCKRRAEDMGSSHFFIAPSENQNQPNQGECWVYAGNGNPNTDIDNVFKFDETGAACHRVNNPEADEDGFMKAYSTASLPRMYGKKTEIPIEPLPNPSCDHTRKDGCIFDSYKHQGNGTCVPQTKTPKPDTHENCAYWASTQVAWAKKESQCEKNPGHMLQNCQTSCRNSKAWQQSNIMNDVSEFTYGGLYNYSKDQLKDWLKALHTRNGSGIERAAVNKYIEKCKGTKGYTFLDDNYVQPTQRQVSVGVYALKSGGLTGVNKGAVGKLAYIDHNGEKHEYPPSALSYTAPASYITLNGYDTRSAESSYGLKEAKKRNTFPLLANMPNWEMIIQFRLDGGSGWRPLIGNMYNDTLGNRGWGWGLWISPSNKIHWSWKYNKGDFDLKVDNSVHYQLTIINSPTTLSMVLKKVSKGTEEKQTITKPNNAVMATDGPVTVGGWHRNKNEKFPGIIISISVPKSSYMVDYPGMGGADIPLSIPMPVDESVNGTMEQCRAICDPDEKCGGFVYTKGAGSEVGRCEMKDRTKMYPVGLRVTDPTKQLVMKVPNISDSIKDPSCRNSISEPKRVEIAYMYGPWIGNDRATEIKFLDDGRHVYMFYDGHYTKMVSEDNQEKYYVGNIDKFNPSDWNSYSNTGGGKYLLRKTGQYKEISRNISVIKYSMVDRAQYDHYPWGRAMSSDSKCDMKGMIPKDGSLPMPNIEPVIEITESAVKETQEKTAEYQYQTQGASSGASALLGGGGGDADGGGGGGDAGAGAESFTTLREGLTYVDTMRDVKNNLTKIANAEYQRERLVAISEESNKVLIAESYKFILWSILAILVVLALIKLKETFGQDDADDGDSGGGGLIASILGLFSIGKIDTSDIADKTGDVKNALSSAGSQFKEGAEQLSKNITEGADNMMSSANEAAMGAMEGAQGFADKVSETATDTVNRVGDAVNGGDDGGGGGGGGATTGGKRMHRKK